jgi:hypothetical protein
MDVDDDFDSIPLDRWDEFTDDLLEQCEEDLARAGARYLREFAEDHIRQNRGTYVRRIRGDVFGGRWAVHDQRSVYGPWLAGTSKRNRNGSFKGYPHWEQARDLLENEKVDLIEPKLRGYRPRLRGSA